MLASDVVPHTQDQRRLLLSLVKTIDRSSRVLYVDQYRNHWTFQRGVEGIFEMFSCTACGEPVSAPAASISHVSLDYAPAGDSSTAVSFRAWRVKHNLQTNTLG
jgi:hypothetical protein